MNAQNGPGRAAGILMHLTSLPGRHGCGTLGEEARSFAAGLAEAGQGVWQVLPVNPVCGHLGHSPYSSPSTFAGSELLVSLDDLAADGLLAPADLLSAPFDPAADFNDFDAGRAWRRPRLEEAGRRLQAEDAPPGLQAEFAAFRQAEQAWLDDYALFMALAESRSTFDWTSWGAGLARRRLSALEEARRELAGPIAYHTFVQFAFFRQWRRLHRHCRQLGVQLVGDIPIYVSFESADCWARPDLFQLDGRSHRPARVAGVPPDYFSASGQRWGNPLYQWTIGRRLNPRLCDWWARRLAHLLGLFDLLRIDHFRGFESYWAIPAGEATAVNGRWLRGPGRPFFAYLERRLGAMPLIAEDLGVITPAVERLRDGLGLPGMKVLQFAFGGDRRHPYLPHNYRSANCLVYTGTHDNNTSNGWFYGDETDEETKRTVLDYLGVNHRHEFHWQFIRLAYASIARLAIVPMQDVLGYAGEFRMNTPGRAGGNWNWRLTPGRFGPEVRSRLRQLAELYGRLPEPADSETGG